MSCYLTGHMLLVPQPRGYRLLDLRQFMREAEYSVFCCHLDRLLHLWAIRVPYWHSPRPAMHFVRVSGSLRDRRARQSYKVKYLGLALALQVSVIILLEAFWSCWIIMEVRVYACHLSSVGGWRKLTRGAGEKCLPSRLCHRWNTIAVENLLFVVWRWSRTK